jgi:DNA-directed RNA polymerase specialized sigma24 family protein
VPRDVVALVSAEDFVSAVRVYTDRVNDLLRRNGVPALEAVEICETHSLALLDAVVNAPETVVDLAGWWFARAIEIANDADRAPVEGASDQPISMLAGTTSEGLVRAALADLPDAERGAVVLRDAYDLPPQAVGVALRRGTDSAAELTALGRLHLVAMYDSRRVPDLSGHSGRTTVDVVSLSKLADGSLEPARAAPLRRHTSNCAACEDMLEVLSKGRRLAAGLPIIAMDDDAREALIERISSRADAVLPSHEAVLQAVDEDHDPGPLVSPVIAVIALVLAASLGVAIGLIRQADSTPAPVPAPTQTLLPSPQPSFPTAITPTHRRGKHPLSATTSNSAGANQSKRSRQSTSPSAPPTTSSSPARSARPAVTISPTSGRQGTTITVAGTGFPADTTVRLSYASGRSTSSARVSPDGSFIGHVQANALLPGTQQVTARDGSASAHATFTQQL